MLSNLLVCMQSLGQLLVRHGGGWELLARERLVGQLLVEHGGGRGLCLFLISWPGPTACLPLGGPRDWKSIMLESSGGGTNDCLFGIRPISGTDGLAPVDAWADASCRRP